MENINCDICGKGIKITPKGKYDLEKGEWLVYCFECSEKIGLDIFKAKKEKIKIYGKPKK